MRKYMSVSQARRGSYYTNAGMRQLVSASAVLSEAKKRSVGASRIFVSHSSKDENLLSGPVSVLKQHQGIIYLDKTDASLPAPSMAETARRIRDVIHECGKLVVIATSNATKSKWIPWELGVADGAHGYEKAAIFPLTESGVYENWIGSEYIGTYPRIYYDDSRGEWRVYDPTDRAAWSLETWIGLS